MNAPLLPGFDVAPPAASVPRASSPVKPPAPPVTARLEMSPTYFRARQFLHTLSRQDRAAVVVRSRFHSMPWLRRADDTDPDDLP